ncbi:unnamed protein product [Sphenostylis stenocarpa]|uniref:Uncharacterized protein n=1 Tax=Sphenostylis stenocarpa TaxID=92480 RepID=A0AA86VHL6_9FABA|nr:unnamed protein product [Sphenostylis stenocarpa]
MTSHSNASKALRRAGFILMADLLHHSPSFFKPPKTQPSSPSETQQSETPHILFGSSKPSSSTTPPPTTPSPSTTSSTCPKEPASQLSFATKTSPSPKLTVHETPSRLTTC